MLSCRSTRLKASWSRSGERHEDVEESHCCFKFIKHFVVFVHNVIADSIKWRCRTTPTRDLSSHSRVSPDAKTHSLYYSWPAVFLMTANTPMSPKQCWWTLLFCPDMFEILFKWLPGWKFSMRTPVARNAAFHPKAARLFSGPSASGCPRFIR